MALKLTEFVQRNFINQFENAFRKSLKVYGRAKDSDSLLRGRRRCNSGVLEDLFAGLMFDHVVRDARQWLILVDYPVVFAKGSFKKSKAMRYPDFALCRKASEDSLELVYMADLKTNTGFFRGQAVDVAKKMRKEVGDFARSNPKLSHVKIGNQKFALHCSPKLKYDLISYSNANANANELDLQQCRIARNTNASVRMHILCNWSNQEGQVPRPEDFKNIEIRIKEQMKEVEK